MSAVVCVSQPLRDHMLVLAKPQDESDFPGARIGHPRIADELAIAHQRGDFQIGKHLPQTIQEDCALVLEFPADDSRVQTTEIIRMLTVVASFDL